MFAIDTKGGWRRISNDADLREGETFSATEPAPYENVQQTIVVTKAQGELALLYADKLEQVKQIIDSIPDPFEKAKAQIEYNRPIWERSNPFLKAVWTQLGGDEAGLDALFIDARGR